MLAFDPYLDVLGGVPPPEAVLFPSKRTGTVWPIQPVSQLLSMAWASSAPRWARLAFSALESWPGMDAAGVPWRRE